jgi:PAS domain S-box-containing protein
LRESEYKRRQIIDSAIPGMLQVTGPDGEVTRVNQRTLDFTGAGSVEDLLSVGWKKFLHPEDFPKTTNAFFHAIQTGESYENLRRVRRVDGEYRWHHVRAEPSRDREDASSSGTACLLISMKARRSKGDCAATKPIWRKHRG